MEALNAALTQVDLILQSYTFDAYQRVADANMQVIQVLLVIYVSFYGIGVMRGAISAKVLDAALHVFKVVVVVAVATKWNFFSEWVYTLVINGSDEVLGALLTPLTASGGGSSDTVTSNLGAVLNTGMTQFSRINQNVSFLSFGQQIIAGIGYVILIGLGAVTAFLIIVSKIFLAILMVLAPVFVPMLLFSPTKGIFEGWLKSLITFTVLPLILFAVMSIFIVILDNLIERMALSDELTIEIVLPVFLLMVAGIIAFLSVAPVASSIGGGAAVSALAVLGTLYAGYSAARGAVNAPARGFDSIDRNVSRARKARDAYRWTRQRLAGRHT